MLSTYAGFDALGTLVHVVCSYRFEAKVYRALGCFMLRGHILRSFSKMSRKKGWRPGSDSFSRSWKGV